MIGLVSISNGQHTQQPQFPEQKPQITQIIGGSLPALVGALLKHIGRFLLPDSAAVSMSILKAESAAWLNRERLSHLIEKSVFNLALGGAGVLHFQSAPCNSSHAAMKHTVNTKLPLLDTVGLDGANATVKTAGQSGIFLAQKNHHVCIGILHFSLVVF